MVNEAALNFRSRSHPFFCPLWFWAGPHQCSPAELPNSWTQGLLLPLLPRNLRKVQALGLQQEYRSEDGILKSFVQKTAATRFVPLPPPSFIRVAWQGVQQEASESDNVDDFITYFDSTWINGQFRLKQWNYYDYDGPRTNNHVEGWHSRLKWIVGKPHPNIFEIVDVIRKEQATI